MTEDEFRADLIAAVASRAQVQACGSREAFTSEMLDRLSQSGEVPDTELCIETLLGHRGRKLEIDAWAHDDADGSTHIFVSILDGRAEYPSFITLTEARELGFNRALGVFEQARDGWLSSNIEESRPLWALAQSIRSSSLPNALRLHVLTDRPISERLREIQGDSTREGVPITFQIWDVTRLRRIHQASSVRDDLIIDFSDLPEGGLPVLSASAGIDDYEGYLAVIPGEVLAKLYLRHGSRLLEGNIRTFLGRGGRVNKGIAVTVAKEPSKFFAFNNGIAATASSIEKIERADGSILLTSATDLQIVNGAQTTASLAASHRENLLAERTVLVPMKLSVVAPTVAPQLIPLISRYANSQNGVRPSDFFANHAFHQRIEEISRRILAPAASGSQVQTHWYYERARGQHLNDQAGLTASKRNQFLLINPRKQVVTKTDLAKIECCFNLEPDVACKGAEKAFVAFADKISKEWEDESKRSIYGDDWFRGAVGRVMLFRSAESVVSRAPWYQGGYRAQIVAYTCARLAQLASEEDSGGLDYARIWAQQSVDPELEAQILAIAESMLHVLQQPPLAGQNISEWAKQSACRSTALAHQVPKLRGFDQWTISAGEARTRRRQQRSTGKIDQGLDDVAAVLAKGSEYWRALRQFCEKNLILTRDDEKALVPACQIPRMIPSDKQAERLLRLVQRAVEEGWKSE